MLKPSLKKIKVITKPNIPATLKQLDPGTYCRFKPSMLGNLTSVQNAVWRLNQTGENFAIELINNGELIVITRKE